MTIQKSRGYRYEISIVNRINKCKGWKAWRLGGTQIELPDILAVNNDMKTLLVIEAKYGGGNLLYVKAPQIKRILDWKQYLSLYSVQKSILAFKFHNIDNKKLKPAEYFFNIAGEFDYRCNRKGELDFSYQGKHDKNKSDWLGYFSKYEQYRMPCFKETKYNEFG